MAGSFEVKWLAGGILLLRRSGLFTLDEARAYVTAAEKELTKTPVRWGAIVDLRQAIAQTDEVQELVQGLVRKVAAKGPLRMAVVTTSTITTIQERRITIGPGLHDAATTDFFDDYDTALQAMRKAVM
jgi:hypothetical protein